MSLTLANAHARVPALSVMWDATDHQLVAGVFSAADTQTLLALKAELEKNTASQLTLALPKGDVALTGARRGFARVHIPHDKFHSQGSTLALQHWKALDPRDVVATATDPIFYVVARPTDCLTQLFAERLQLALNVPIQLAWGEKLLALGQDVGLVQPLAVAHHRQLPPTAQPFRAGLRVNRNDRRWHTEVLAPALQHRHLAF